MQKLVNWMETRLAPPLNKITQNDWVSAITNSLMTALPLILVGSFVSILTAIGAFVPWLANLQPINDFTFGLFGIVVAFLIPYTLMERKELDGSKAMAGILGLSLYLMLAKVVMTEEGMLQVEFARLGAGGIFISIIAGLFSAFMMYIFIKRGMFSKNSKIPAFVSSWFEAIIPMTITLLIGWALTYLLDLDVFTIITNLASPLVDIGQSFWGFVLIYFLVAFLFSFGVTVWWVTPIWFPIILAGIAANAEMVAQGMAATNINTWEVTVAWLAIGGMGCTLPLGIMMLRSKAKRLKAIGKATLLPSVMNINEPLVFGAPVAWNPILMIPMWINGLLIPIITFITLNAQLVTVPSSPFYIWFIPVGVSTYLTNYDWRGLILLAVLIVVATVVWYPFFKVHERRVLKKEQEELAAGE